MVVPSDNQPDKQGEILSTAAEIFWSKGFHAASMGEIAEAVDLTKAGLYYYVRGKEDLLYEIVNFGMGRLEAWIEAARDITDPAERLRAVLYSHALGITRDGSTVTLLVDEAQSLGPGHREEIRRRQRAYFDFVRRTLEELQERGDLGDVDPRIAAFGVLGSVMWTARWYRPNGELEGSQIARQIADMAMRGLLQKETV